MSRPPLISSLLAALVLVTAPNPAIGSRIDFQQATLTAGEGRWLSYSDEVAGGTSEVEYAIVDQDGARHLDIRGKLTAGFFYPFAGVQWLFHDNGTPRDLSAYQGVRFRARGDGNVYRAQILLATVRDNNNYAFEFAPGEQWAQYEVRFADLKQAEWGAQVAWDASLARGIGFHIDGGVVDFALAIDDIELY
jgi:hypothetical protein